MMISEDPSFTEAEWFQYENPASYELSEGDGDKMVYAKLGDDNYNETEARQDSIFMDTQAPTSEIENLPDNTGEQTFDVEYTSADAEPTSGIEYVSLYYKHYDEVPTGGYSNTHRMSNNLFDNTYMPSGSLNGGPFEQDPTDGWIHYETKDETEGYFEFDSTTAEGDGLYFFISVAGDTAGNVEEYKPEEEAERVVIMTGEGDEVAVLPVITPNNDGYNDLVPFDVLCGGSNAVLKIYNRKHTLVYEEEGQSPVWDGCDSGGVPVPGGVYFYQLETDSDTYFGTITVIK
jgi:gliding motility-associated-like protein